LKGPAPQSRWARAFFRRIFFDFHILPDRALAAASYAIFNLTCARAHGIVRLHSREMEDRADNC
jgi:hypothetical protein